MRERASHQNAAVVEHEVPGMFDTIRRGAVADAVRPGMLRRRLREGSPRVLLALPKVFG